MKKIHHESSELKYMRPPDVMPFYFRVEHLNPEEHPVDRYPEKRRYFVKIASFDMKSYDSSWMCCEYIGDYCLVPDVDIAYGIYEFDSEKEAIEFIQEWWRLSLTGVGTQKSES